MLNILDRTVPRGFIVMVSSVVIHPKVEIIKFSAPRVIKVGQSTKGTSGSWSRQASHGSS